MTSDWKSIILSIVGLVITSLLLPLMKSWINASKAKADALNAEADHADMDRGRLLLDRVKAYLWGTAAAIMEEQAPDIARDIIAGELSTADAIKSRLYSMGQLLKSQAIEYFRGQGIDLIEELGHQGIDNLIRRAADAVSPFPGKETAVELLKNGVANKLLDYGVDWVKQQYLNTLGETRETTPVGTTV